MNPCVVAKRIANSLRTQGLEALRGITLLSDAGAAVVFGNDDYANDCRTREQVRLILDHALLDGVEVLGFETDDEGHSAWAMVLRCTDLDWLRLRLREASYQSHCRDAPPRRLIIGEIIHSTDSSTVGVGGAVAVHNEPELEAIDEIAYLVEGENRSF
jgi:hypothetical protein